MTTDEEIVEILKIMKDDLARGEEFLIMPKAEEYVIVGDIALDAIFQVVSGFINDRFAYNFAGSGLRSHVFVSMGQAKKTLTENRLWERYPAVSIVDRYEYIKGWVERQKQRIEFFETHLPKE